MLGRSSLRRNSFDRRAVTAERFAAGIAVVLLSLSLLPAARADPAERAVKAAGAPMPQFGSPVVLERLWTPEQLQGTAAEGKIIRLRSPDRTPPDNSRPAEAATPKLSRTAKSIRLVPPRGGERLVALTFDLCERADQISGYDGATVDVLRRERVPATFFAGGKWMRTHPERAMQLIADPLFEIGDHGWTHGNLRVLTGGKAEDQIVWAQQEYTLLRQRLVERAAKAGVDAEEISRIPAAPATFRFPYGACSPQSLQMTGRLGLAAIQWDVISGDADPGTTAERVVRTVLAGVRPGSIVVMHANGRGHGTACALPEIVAGLRAKGYRFVTVSELLQSGEPVAADGCYELRPGDNRRYDRLFGEGTG